MNDTEQDIAEEEREVVPIHQTSDGNESDDCSHSSTEFATDELSEALFLPSKVRRWKHVGLKSRILQKRKEPTLLAADLQQRLELAVQQLLDQLAAAKPSRGVLGLTLPASAVGWMVHSLYSLRNLPSEGSDAPVEDTPLRRNFRILENSVPLITHVRITSDVWPPRRKPKETLSDQPAVEEMNDRAARQFLEFFDRLLYRPLLDLSIFSNCRVVWIDGVPPSWIFNLHDMSTLEVLRMDKSCVNDLDRLLQPPADDGIDEADPLAPPRRQFYPNLAHVKFEHCCLNKSSNMRGRRIASGKRDFGPLTALQYIETLDLSHNELQSERDALAGLRHLPRLSRLNLSYNWLTSLEKAHYRLGNIQSLRLSHNQLRTVAGIEHVVSLEELWLDFNEITNIADLRGLTRLKLLERLELEGNPLQVTQLRKYRTNVLSVFVASRISDLGPNATLGELKQVLPKLDGIETSVRELKRLKKGIFRPLVTPHSDDILTDSQLEQEASRDGSLPSEIPTVVSLDRPAKVQRSSQKRVVRLGLDHHVLTRQEIDLTGLETSFTTDEALRAMLTATSSPMETNDACEDDECSQKSDESPLSQISAGRDLYDSYLLAAAEQQKKISSNKNDAIEGSDIPEADSLSDGATNVNIPDHVMGGTVTDEEEAPQEKAHADVEPSATESDEEAHTEEGTTGALKNSSAEIEQSSTEEEKPVVDKVQISEPNRGATVLFDNMDMDYDLDNELGGELFEGSKVSHNPIIGLANPGLMGSATEKSSLNKNDSGQKRDLVESAATNTTVAESNGDERNSGPTTPVRSRSPQIPESEPDTSDNTISSAMSPFHNTGLGMRVVSENLWQDESSVPGSIASPTRSEVAGPNKYLLAEKNASFEGLDHYKNLNVLEHLEFYFRQFVFRDDMKVTSPRGRRDDWREVLERYPRIQLWMTDRRLLEADEDGHSVSREEFRRLWTGQVVGCGRPALRRTTPNRNARYGFHGEILWSASETSHLKPDTVSEPRSTILCMSNEAFYVITGDDKVSAKALETRKTFPLPIPHGAVFNDARFPHAMARHSWGRLYAITIGFGFQRLTLRFESQASTNEYVYILLTANKMETFNLLKEIQQLAADSKERAAGGTIMGGEVAIENDDRIVLDSVGATVAPDMFGMILHYQILLQRWRRGDRGYVKRVCIVTDTKLYLLDEDYVGDGSESVEAGSRTLGDPVFRLVDSTDLSLLERIEKPEPESVTIVVRPASRLQRMRNWRLVCRNAEGAERFVEDLRKAWELTSE